MSLDQIEESLGIKDENIVNPSLIVLEKKGIIIIEDK